MKDYFAHQTALIDEKSQIGEGSKIWQFSHIMNDSILGSNCNIGQNVVVSPKVILGKNVKVQNNVSLYTGVICEDNVFIGPSAVFTNILNPRSEVIRRDQYISTLVCEGATIGANATIVCGITLGRYSFIGAGTVVTKDVPDYALVIGNPSKHVGWMSEKGAKLNFENGFAICEESDEKYNLVNQSVTKVK